jgi:MerR family copper efflux transcriptional regulator
MNQISIGILAKKSELSVATLRYYEQLGLIQSGSRQAGQPRHFPIDVIRRLEALHLLQDLGFTLREIRALMRMVGSPSIRCAKFMKKLQEKLDENEAALERRRKRRDKLKLVFNNCKSPKIEFKNSAIGELLGMAKAPKTNHF